MEIKIFAERLKLLRKKAGLSQQEVSDITKTTKSAVSMWERGVRTPELETFESLALLFRTSPSYLLGWDALPAPTGADLKRVPYFESLEVGCLDWLDAKAEPFMVADDPLTDFCFRVQGENLRNMGIRDGAIAFVRNTSEAEDGNLVIAQLSGGDVDVWRYHRYQDTVVLRPENPDFQEVAASPGDVQILGVIRSFKIFI